MRLRTMPALLALSLIAAPASAQTPDWVQVMISAAGLPIAADSARKEGVPSDDVRAVLESMRNKNIPANEAKDILNEARAAHREHGPVDNFGAFVQAKLDAGLRGRDLAAAIRAEHAARGKGKAGAAKGADRDRGKSPAASDAKGKSPGAAGDAKGKSPAARGDSGKAARPDAAGRGKRPDNR